MRLDILRLWAATLCLGAACAGASKGATIDDARDTVAGDGWHALIDDGLTAWRGYRQPSVPAGWRVADGVLMKDSVAEDLISRQQFGNFELAFDWRLAPGGNSGVFYRATEEYDHVYWSGPEYQLLDDAGHPDGKNPLTSAGSAYAIYAPPAGVTKPAGEWNSSRIIVRGRHVEHWLNGQQVVSYELGSPDWEARVRRSKFNEWPNYGRATRGHLGIQGDHRGALAIRALRIRVLP